MTKWKLQHTTQVLQKTGQRVVWEAAVIQKELQSIVAKSGVKVYQTTISRVLHNYMQWCQETVAQEEPYESRSMNDVHVLFSVMRPRQ